MDESPADMLEALLRRRHSCRGFRPQPLPRPLIERILTAAQRTASWCNTQPWRVYVTSGEATERFRRSLHRHAAENPAPASDFPFPREYREPFLARRRECGFQLYSGLGIARGDKAAYGAQAMENFRLFGAPHVAIVTTDEALGVYGAIDCGAYVANFLLAAEALRVATIPQAALASHAGFIRSYFAMPQTRAVVCGISFGYEEPSHPANAFRTSRAPLGEAVEFFEE